MPNSHRIRKKRPSLRVIISSATLDAASLLDYFSDDSNGATVISLEGRMYPVEVAYLEEPVQDYIAKAADVAWSINLQVLDRYISRVRNILTPYSRKNPGTSLYS